MNKDGRVVKGDFKHAVFFNTRLSMDQPHGSVKHHARLRLYGLDHSGLYHGGRSTYHGVTTHRGVLLGVHKDQAKIGLRIRGSREECAIHILPASRFEHKQTSEAVKFIPRIDHLCRHRGPSQGRQAAGHQASRFPGCVRIYG